MRYFHHHHRGAEKAAKRLGLSVESLFPNKQAHAKKYEAETLRAEAAKYAKRSEFQLGEPSMYNSAKAQGLLAELFPVQLNRKYTDSELIALCQKYSTIKEFAEQESGAYQVASRRGLLAKHGPKPTQGTSQAEQELLAFLQTLLPDFKTKRFANDYELDCYSPSRALGVEYNGLFWHSEENKGRQYHRRKTRHFEGLGIRLIHIWEHEWRDRKEQVKNYLRSACGVNSERIGARKCEFREVGAPEARAFLQEQHIQGAPKTVALALGAFYQGQMIAVATFGPHHRKGTAEMVLNRFACLPSYTISGGLAKLSGMAFERLGPLKSWADYSKSQGRGYLAAGWELQETLQPDYFYSDAQGRVISKQSRRKSAVGTPEGTTEAEHAKKDGLYRIWDCGKIVLIFK